jgi:putative DNA primase/helicase
MKKIVNQLEIAVGRNREDKHWKNIKITWPSFLEKLAKPHRTHETVKQYWASTKDQRDQIKDIGGFVGGYLVGGRRLKGSVSYRTLITLDADTADLSFWDTFQMLYDCTACIYTTHSHLPDKPRYRLVVPLDRPINPEQYQPIARRIAGDIGIEQFDNTGFQEERLMYWPSVSKDGDFSFKWQKGPMLNVDDVLATYTNWKDISEWPVSEKIHELILRSQKKQGDPLEKRGIVGAFCRTYNVHEAIEKYLNTVYEKTGIEDRYTYTSGSTANGVITYDDKFAYSHHNTDPISGKLCNSFDLVRLHLYGDDDQGVDSATAPDEMPSYAAMRELATQDLEVRKQIGIERMESAYEDFAHLGIKIDEIDVEWFGNLAVDEKGNYRHTIDNVVMILENDALLKGCIAYDQFRCRNTVMKKLPWRKDQEDNVWTDNDEANMRWYIEHVYGISSPGKVRDAIDVVLQRHVFHPVRDYLTPLVWDGDFRIDNLLIDYFNADDNEYTRTAMRKTMIAAVARVHEPGCKFDYMLVLKGEQGHKKSTFFNILAGEFFSDTFTTIQGKEAYEQIQGHWFIEVGELAGMRKAEEETIKHFITKREDSFRPAYGRQTAVFKRQCILVGTTNKDRFLRDVTGNRRFWVVPIHKKLTRQAENELKELRDQLWAEAVAYYKAGEELYFDDQTEQLAKEVQAQHMETDDRETVVREYLEKLLPVNWDKMTVWQRREFLTGDETAAMGENVRQHVTALEVYTECLGGAAKDFSLRVAREINDIIKNIGDWKYTMMKRQNKMFRGFVREIKIAKNYEN